MDVIPVIDLMRGAVVHARGGQRDTYRPISSALSASHAPAEVVAGLRRRAPFRRLYVADLDAIERHGDHREVLDQLAAAEPSVELWVDNGAAAPAAVDEWLERGPGCLVLGSESQQDAALLRRVRDHPRALLSLDFRGDAFRGPAEILHEAQDWPRRVIVMTLSRVGAAAGPDFDRLGSIIARAGNRQVFAAGGVRNGADLRILADMGAAGVLVATALHAGAITAEDIRDVAGPDDQATASG
jgi:phosphoribosylformimino-5-aminoimidazole carboxamide ribotide isomerase